jgi:flagellar biosynthesis activator protein FlaF
MRRRLSGMYAAQLETYRNMQKTTLSGRDLEAEVLSKAALKLKYCQDNWDNPGREEMLDEALKFNQKIWTVFQSELIKPGNPLPKKLKEDLLSLSVFIDKKIFEVMSLPESEKLTAIININLNIAAGLKGSPV